MSGTANNPYAWEIDFVDSTASDAQYIFWTGFSKICNTIIQIFGGMINFCLLVLVLKIRTKPLLNYKTMLLLGCISDIQVWASESLLQLVSNVKDGVLILTLEGPAKFLPYGVQASVIGLYGLHVGLIIVIQPANYFYRYICVKNLKPPSPSCTLMVYLFASLLAAILGIFAGISFFQSGDTRPNFNYATLWYNIRPLPVLLPADMRSRYTQFYILYALMFFSGSYIICLLFARFTVVHLRKDQHLYSAKTLQMQSQLSAALCIQTILPLFFSVGPCMIISCAAFFGLEIGAMGIILYTCLAWIPFFNPLVTIFIIKPFRMAVLRIFHGQIGMGTRVSSSGSTY